MKCEEILIKNGFSKPLLKNYNSLINEYNNKYLDKEEDYLKLFPKKYISEA